MAYHVTQEHETTLKISSASTPSAARKEALRQVERELSALDDDPRVYNYDLFNATVEAPPTPEYNCFTATVTFTVTASVYTDSHLTASTTGTTTIEDALDDLLETQTPVGEAAVQESV